MTQIISDLNLDEDSRGKFDELCDNLIEILKPENRDKLLKRENLAQLNYLSSVQAIDSTYRCPAELDNYGIYAEIFFTFKGMKERCTDLKFQGRGKQKI